MNTNITRHNYILASDILWHSAPVILEFKNNCVYLLYINNIVCITYSLCLISICLE